jgi:circadian clock protein KaiC
MNATDTALLVEKLETGIPGFDLIANGGLPKGRTTLVSGTTGSAKTVLACQFLAEGIRKAGEHGVFVTFEEAPDSIRRNMLGLGWNILDLESKGQWAFVDASPRPDDESVAAGAYDLGALLARIEYAARKINARRVAMDSLGAIFSRFNDADAMRAELFRISYALKELGVTTIMTAEPTQHGELSRFGMEQLVADNVIILRNVLDHEKRRRTIEILKFRGTSHQKGEFPFTVVPGVGLVVVPPSAVEMKHTASAVRITSGNLELDKMCGSGFFRDSIILVSGATGNGKTLMATEFIAGGAASSERCVLFAFEESRGQLIRNATGWGIDLEQMERDGKLKVVCDCPEVISLEDHLIHMKAVIDEFKPNRVAVDSLSALEPVSSIKGFREFVIGLTSFLKHEDIVGLFTATTPNLVGGTSVTGAHISTIADSIILLSYVEMYGEVRRGITVLKMRGSMHDKGIREYTIDGKGMHIDQPFRNMTGILAGNPVQLAASELDRSSSVSEASS